MPSRGTMPPAASTNGTASAPPSAARPRPMRKGSRTSATSSPPRQAEPDRGTRTMSDTEAKPTIYKGLVGVYADVSTISKVMPETNSLTYGGYAVQDLCETCSFEEGAYLLWHGELPNAAQLKAFNEEVAAERAISPALHRVIREYPKDAHPMDMIRTAVSFMGLEDPETAGIPDAARRGKAKRLLAKIPTAIAAAPRASKGLEPIEPNPSHS